MRYPDAFLFRLRKSLRLFVPVVWLALLAACGGGSGATLQPPPAANNGSVLWSIHDAEGDFVSYKVTIEQITLTRNDGLAVKALPAPVDVDLAQLVEASTLFGNASIPSGTYTSMSIDINYANADIAAEDAQGQVVALKPVTDSGATAGTLTATIDFTSDTAIVVQKGTPLLASLEFDLGASNTIDFTATPPTVTVSPFLYAVANPADLPYTRATGTLTAVDLNASTYTIDIEPLFYSGTQDFGSLTVATGAQTTYSINGTGYVGAAGLEALSKLAMGTATLAYGTYDPQAEQFQAEEVYAGTSVPGVNADTVHGVVTARSGNTLTVVGLTYINATDDTLWHSTVTVSVGTQTSVYKAGDPTAQVGIGDISVGQRVTILGTLTDTMPSSLAMDAGAQDTGYVRLAPTSAAGKVVAINSSQLTLALSELARHPPDWYDFTGTGSTLTLDADPTNYQINTGTLNLSGLTLGEPAEVTGFVQPFGQAPPDFKAENIGNFTQCCSRMMVLWRPTGTAAPFSTQESALLVINLSDPNIGPVAAIHRGGMRLNMMTMMMGSPQIVPPASGVGLYAIRVNGSVTVYVSFSAFESAMQSQLNGSIVMKAFFADGGYASGTNTFTAKRIAVLLK